MDRFAPTERDWQGRDGWTCGGCGIHVLNGASHACPVAGSVTGLRPARTEEPQRAVDAYFERQSAALAGKTIERIGESRTYPKCSVIEFTDGSSIVVAAMPWNWWLDASWLP